MTTPPIERGAAAHGPAYLEWNTTFLSGQAIEPAARFVTRAVLSEAIVVDELAQVIQAHGHLQPDTEPEDDGTYVLAPDTEWFCNECQEYVGTGEDVETIIATHQAAAVRAHAVGRDQ